MRRTLILVIILLLITLFIYMILSVTNIGSLSILGIKALNDENEILEQKIEQASKLSSTDYERALIDLNASAKDYTLTKQSYEELANVSTEGEIQLAKQLETYEIEYLWTRIGNHATAENVAIKMEISANTASSTTGYYDLNFTATGSYVGITDFIYDIENDSSLGFKIDNFKMLPDTGANTKTKSNSKEEAAKEEVTLQATFTCRDISINIDPAEVVTTENQNEVTTEKDETTTKDNTVDK